MLRLRRHEAVGGKLVGGIVAGEATGVLINILHAGQTVIAQSSGRETDWRTGGLLVLGLV